MEHPWCYRKAVCGGVLASSKLRGGWSGGYPDAGYPRHWAYDLGLAYAYSGLSGATPAIPLLAGLAQYFLIFLVQERQKKKKLFKIFVFWI